MYIEKLTEHNVYKSIASVLLERQNNTFISIVIAVTIFSCWLLSLVQLFKLNIADLSSIEIILGVCLRSFLHTGIFIIIHEAIHGVIVSNNRRINDYIGYAACILYALLPYRTLAENHSLHHSSPATELDPDFYSADSNNFVLWYISFMQKYQSGKQFWILFWGMTFVFWTFIYLKVPTANIFLFWVIPIVISSLQLFTFGIFLPHRNQELNMSDRHRAKSINYPTILSFVACYHFGYHWEHHQHPYLPWYKLPSVRDRATKQSCHTSER